MPPNSNRGKVAPMFAGIEIAGYKSFGDEFQTIAPLDRINVLIGPNNSGKSTTLGFFTHHLANVYQAVANDAPIILESTYRRRVNSEAEPPFRVAWPTSSPAHVPFQDALGDRVIEFLLSSWPRFAWNNTDQRMRLEEEYLVQLEGLMAEHQWQGFTAALIGQASALRQNVEAVFNHLKRLILDVPPGVVTVPAHRQITPQRPDGTIPDTWDPSGAGLLRQLDKLMRPQADDAQSRQRRDGILEHVRSVLELDGFTYYVALETNDLVLTIDGESRDLDAVGTGYEHILLLVGATIIYPDALLCVEEPEVHMHPRLQRRLADYLKQFTENQMLLSTHSAALIDALRGTTFRLALRDNATFVSRPVETDLLDLFGELGYRASDLLQSNCVIWVEGASDRIYVNHWIEAIDPSLEEGVDYSIMFYGGSMVAHLSLANDGDAQEGRVPLRRLNQKFVLIADSDMRSSEDPLLERVDRLLAEAEDDPFGKLWVTAGRTIENYIASDILGDAVREIHPSVTEILEPDTQWDDPLVAVGRDGQTPFKVDKVKLSLFISKLTPDLDVLDLRAKVEMVVDFIHSANA